MNKYVSYDKIISEIYEILVKTLQEIEEKKQSVH